MPIYEFGKDSISRVKETTFSEVGLHERQDLQRLLREQVEVTAPGTLVISEEFGDWEDARRRIDLLGIDKDANLVVIELKRTEDGGHMELQSIRYAAMVSTMTFDQAADVYGRYLTQPGKENHVTSGVNFT
jgi:RecB family endonuclease NucS